MNSSVTPGSEIIPRLTGQESELPHPPSISAKGGGGKFDASGAPLFFPGNTFICHIDTKSAFYKKLCQLQDALKALPQAGGITFLPKESFHMTVFGGVGGEPLCSSGWPEDINKNSSLDAINHSWCERVKQSDYLGGFNVVPMGMRAPYSLAMQAATETDALALQQARTKLQSLTQLVRDDFRSYRFHITLGYLVNWLDEASAQELVSASNHLFDHYLGDCEPVRLGAVEFCRFESMHQFTPLCLFEQPC